MLWPARITHQKQRLNQCPLQCTADSQPLDQQEAPDHAFMIMKKLKFPPSAACKLRSPKKRCSPNYTKTRGMGGIGSNPEILNNIWKQGIRPCSWTEKRLTAPAGTIRQKQETFPFCLFVCRPLFYSVPQQTEWEATHWEAPFLLCSVCLFKS